MGNIGTELRHRIDFRLGKPAAALLNMLAAILVIAMPWFVVNNRDDSNLSLLGLLGSAGQPDGILAISHTLATGILIGLLVGLLLMTVAATVHKTVVRILSVVMATLNLVVYGWVIYLTSDAYSTTATATFQDGGMGGGMGGFAYHLGIGAWVAVAVGLFLIINSFVMLLDHDN